MVNTEVMNGVSGTLMVLILLRKFALVQVALNGRQKEMETVIPDIFTDFYLMNLFGILMKKALMIGCL